MFEKPLMLAGLKKQYRNLGELMELAGRDELMEREKSELLRKTRETASNLRRLRRIRRSYGIYLNGCQDNHHAGDRVRMLAEQ